MGETNILLERDRRPLSRAVLARACEVYLERFGLPDGRVPATFDIVSLTGWAPAAPPGTLQTAPRRPRLTPILPA
jgi:hypothetical protein